MTCCGRRWQADPAWDGRWPSTPRGDLVPDELIFSILVPVVVAAARETGGYVLDGFPRTMPQALSAAELGVELALTSNAVIYLTAPEDELVGRLLDRAQRDGRADDTLGVIRHWPSSPGEPPR